MIPMRSCIACRRRESATVLLHIVVINDRVIPDPHHRLGGRGAWLHPQLQCFEVARQRRSFGRAFKSVAELSTEELEHFLTNSTTHHQK